MRRKYTQDFIACTQLTARRSWPLRGKPHSHITCRCDTLQTERCFWKRQSFGLCSDVQGQQSRVERDTVQKGLTTHINDLNSKIKWTQWHWTQFNIWNLSCANLKICPIKIIAVSVLESPSEVICCPTEPCVILLSYSGPWSSLCVCVR